jgi:hypothetical protein
MDWHMSPIARTSCHLRQSGNLQAGRQQGAMSTGLPGASSQYLVDDCKESVLDRPKAVAP